MAILRKDDPVYYKAKMQELIKSAEDNGLKVTTGRSYGGTHVYFRADNGECAGVIIKETEKEYGEECR